MDQDLLTRGNLGCAMQNLIGDDIVGYQGDGFGGIEALGHRGQFGDILACEAIAVGAQVAQ